MPNTLATSFRPWLPPSGELARQRLRGRGLPGCTPSVIACADATFPKGTAFGGGDKVSGVAIRRPLGGAGCDQREQTEGVLPLYYYII